MIQRGDYSKVIVERFCLFLKDQGKTPLTIKNYRYDIEGFVRWAELRKDGKFNLEDFASENVKQYRAWIIQSLKAGSINRKLAALKGFLRWAAVSGLMRAADVSELGNVEFERTERPRPRWLDSTEQARLYRAVEAGGKAKDIAAITLMLYAGIRASELCELRWTAVRICADEGTLVFKRPRITRETRIPLRVEAQNALISMGYGLHAGTDQFIFVSRSGPMTVRGIDMLVDRYSKIAGIKNVTPGTLRHSFGMNLVHAGNSPFIITQLMGVSSFEMIRRYHRPQQMDEVTESMLTPAKNAAGI